MGIWDLKWTSQHDFSVAGGVKVGLAMVYFPGQDCVSIMNDGSRLRFEFIVHNHHHAPAFKSRVVTVPATVPYVSHQDGVGISERPYLIQRNGYFLCTLYLATLERA
eukprot:scaffold33699_cov36-Cyclotella_meneghiniana.AAC.3